VAFEGVLAALDNIKKYGEQLKARYELVYLLDKATAPVDLLQSIKSTQEIQRSASQRLLEATNHSAPTDKKSTEIKRDHPGDDSRKGEDKKTKVLCRSKREGRKAKSKSSREESTRSSGKDKKELVQSASHIADSKMEKLEKTESRRMVVSDGHKEKEIHPGHLEPKHPSPSDRPNSPRQPGRSDRPPQPSSNALQPPSFSPTSSSSNPIEYKKCLLEKGVPLEDLILPAEVFDGRGGWEVFFWLATITMGMSSVMQTWF
jgi:hypothetical protein